jgi:TetR/AcrR family transcriptional repressor of lmrAB and yxaGH operons
LLDTTPKSERLSLAIKDVMESWINCLADQITRFHPERNGRAPAMKILVSLEGAWILARMLRSREPFDQVMSVIAANEV